jgi:hypothetical protein
MFSENSRGGRAKQALIGDLLSRVQDVNISVPGIKNATITGGLRPSALGEMGRATGGELSRQALLALMEGDQFQGGERLQAPGLTPLPKPSTLDTILSIAGPAASIAGGLSGIMDADKPSSYVPQVGAKAGPPNMAGVPGDVDLESLYEGLL